MNCYKVQWIKIFMVFNIFLFVLVNSVITYQEFNYFARSDLKFYDDCVFTTDTA